jgi:hypothetical protein
MLSIFYAIFMFVFGTIFFDQLSTEQLYRKIVQKLSSRSNMSKFV